MTFEEVLAMPETDDPVWTNIEPGIDEKILAQLDVGGCRAQHAAWDYCGWVWKDGEGWHEIIMRWGSVVETLHGDNAQTIITQALEEFGRA